MWLTRTLLNAEREVAVPSTKTGHRTTDRARHGKDTQTNKNTNKQTITTQTRLGYWRIIVTWFIRIVLLDDMKFQIIFKCWEWRAIFYWGLKNVPKYCTMNFNCVFREEGICRDNKYVWGLASVIIMKLTVGDSGIWNSMMTMW